MAPRPFVTLKLATSLDGRIATASGESRWITGEAARRAGHELRASHDAVLVGIGTALADDPQLNVRLDGYAGSQPLRVVLDSRQQIHSDSKLVSGARAQATWIFTLGTPQARLLDAGVRVSQVAADQGRIDLAAVLTLLADYGVKRLLVEGGGEVAASFVRRGLVDALEWFRAPILLGSEGRPALGALNLAELKNAPRFRWCAVEKLGEDAREQYDRIP
jgi:diaminohydroxyphosphoribosylaminopyrimidine deaminase/5-amino-6-(5-phosphoribosylamino)uracil reductase